MNVCVSVYVCTRVCVCVCVVDLGSLFPRGRKRSCPCPVELSGLSPSSCADQSIMRTEVTHPDGSRGSAQQGSAWTVWEWASFVLGNVSLPDCTRGWVCPAQRALCAWENVGPVCSGRRPGTAHLQPSHPGAPCLSSPAALPFLMGCGHPTEGRALGRRPGLCQKGDPGSPWLETRVTPRTAVTEKRGLWGGLTRAG